MNARAVRLAIPMLLLAVSAPALTAQGSDDLRDPREVHLRNIRQLTFDGQNAEAYWAFDGTKLVFQRTPAEGGCDQIFIMDPETGDIQEVSTGKGRTTCSYFYPSGDKIIYASTHHWMESCPAEPDMSRGYVWPLYPTFDLFVSDADGSNLTQITTEFGYDAEATVSPTGDRVVFTSVRDGDLELYTMNLDGSDVRRVTDRLGYDGGAFFSPDGKKLLWRAHYPETEREISDYKSLLGMGMIRPSALEVYIADADGSNQVQVTDNGAANFAPYWHPSMEKIVYSSNDGDPSGREFEIFMVNVDGSGHTQITFSPEFDGFPVFSPDGRYLVFASNRNGAEQGDTNIFIAEWVDQP
jgi:Tol biopolymer transport system component